MTFVFGEFTVTTWGERDGQQVWRARKGDRVVEFTTLDRNAPVTDLIRLARQALS